MDKIRCSVVIAVYNGEKYLRKQLDSVIENITDKDEIIISDDGSTDKSLQIINEFKTKEKRISLLEGPQRGIIANFENAIRHAHGEYIFLCDQDDIWENNKLECIVKCFKENNCLLVIHDADVFNEKEEMIISSFFRHRRSGTGVIKNIIKNTYIGCCMTFHRKLLDVILPIPHNIEMHDQWIGVLGDIYGDNYFYDNVLLHYRRHMNNASSMHHSSLTRMIKKRLVFCLELIKRIYRNRKFY